MRVIDRSRAGKLSLRRLARPAVIAAVLLLSTALAFRASLSILFLIVAAAGAVVLIQHPVLGLLGLVIAALVIPIEIGTGTAVILNPATFLVPALIALWVLDMVRRRDYSPAESPTNRPLFLFLIAGLISILLGGAYWDPMVPRPGGFVVVQFAQWSIFAFSAAAYWLSANLTPDASWLRRLTLLFLVVGGALIVAADLTSAATLFLEWQVATHAIIDIPFSLLLTALAGGLLLFDEKLSAGWQLCLLAILAAVLWYALFQMRESVSTWLGIVSVLGMLAWLRWPRMRWPVVILLVGFTITGALSSAVYEFAGGQAEWVESGGSRLALINRVIEVSMRNPITGIGPAAYRPYARMTPLPYARALWISPNVSSHNNYVDLFSHVGLLGLALFFWFAIESIKLGLKLRPRFRRNFAAGYVNGMLAAWVGSLIVMLLADWILPFVYNIGFKGFQASVLVWLFLGGLVALDAMPTEDENET